MATDDSSSDDWILLNEEESTDIQQESDLIEQENDPKEVENQQPTAVDNEEDQSPTMSVSEGSDISFLNPNDESESFSVISSLSDGFSYLSLIDDISLTSGIRCYLHFRNHKLNKSLDFVLTLTFTLVAGLAIGNFIGLSKNCEFEKYQLVRNCSVNGTAPFGQLSFPPSYTTEKVLDKMKHALQKFAKNDFSFGAADHFALISVSIEDMPQNKHMSIVKPSEVVHQKSDGKPVNENGIHTSMELNSKEQRQSDSDDFTSCNETDKSPMYDRLVQLPTSESLQARNSQSLEPVALIQYLHNTVDEVVHRAVDLTLKLPTERLHSKDEYLYLERTKKVIHEFTHLVKKTLDSLSESVKPNQSKTRRVKDQKFSKITSNIIKAVDNLMKSVFEEVVSKKESIKSRLGKIQHVCLEIIKKLQKNLKKNEKQTDFSDKYDEKFDKKYREQKFDTRRNHKTYKKYEDGGKGKYHESRYNSKTNTYLHISRTG